MGGEFTLQKGPQPRVFIGGGTGITPLMSMLREAAKEPSTPAFLLYRAHHPLVHPLQSNQHITCAVNHTLEGESKLPPSVSSRVTVSPPSTPWTADAIGPLLPTGCQAYICGPSSFTATTLDLLRQVGMKQENIFYECFGPEA